MHETNLTPSTGTGDFLAPYASYVIHTIVLRLKGCFSNDCPTFWKIISRNIFCFDKIISVFSIFLLSYESLNTEQHFRRGQKSGQELGRVWGTIASKIVLWRKLETGEMSH